MYIVRTQLDDATVLEVYETLKKLAVGSLFSTWLLELRGGLDNYFLYWGSGNRFIRYIKFFLSNPFSDKLYLDKITIPDRTQLTEHCKAINDLVLQLLPMLYMIHYRQLHPIKYWFIFFSGWCKSSKLNARIIQIKRSAFCFLCGSVCW